MHLPLVLEGREIVVSVYSKSRPQDQIVTEHAFLTDLSLCQSFLVYEHACKTMSAELHHSNKLLSACERPPLNVDYSHCSKLFSNAQKTIINQNNLLKSISLYLEHFLSSTYGNNF